MRRTTISDLRLVQRLHSD